MPPSLLSPIVWPRPLVPGDEVAVIAPAGPVPRSAFFAGVAWLRERYRLRFHGDLLSAQGYLAGSDERRLAELRASLAMPNVRAIIAARGGYGVTRIVEAITPSEWLSDPRWICGFSDITAIHVETCSVGLASIHSANVTGLAEATSQDRCDLLRILEGTGGARIWTTLRSVGARPIADPPVEGRLFGGNLAILYAQAAAGRLKPPPGAIWLLEDIGERPYRIDRMLTALRGHLTTASAVVFGDFTSCETPADPVTVGEVLHAFADSVRIPVMTGAPFGHASPNAPWVQGARAILAGTTLTMFGRDDGAAIARRDD